MRFTIYFQFHIPYNHLASNTTTTSHADTNNDFHFADDTLKCIFLNESVWILIMISLKFLPLGPINNIPALVGGMPFSEPMMVRLLTHIYISRLNELIKFCLVYAG